LFLILKHLEKHPSPAEVILGKLRNREKCERKTKEGKKGKQYN
jgi:hypothetical protein